MTVAKRILCAFIPYARWRHRLQRGDRTLITLVAEDGSRRKLRPFEFRKLNVQQDRGCHGNEVVVHLPYGGCRVEAVFHGSDNRLEVGSANVGTIDAIFHGDGSRVVFGDGSSLGHVHVYANNCDVRIGSRCLFSDNIMLYAGDQHAILDASDGTLLNGDRNRIVVGDHCWLGRDVAFTKGGAIAADTIVGLRSVVTKPFAEGHVVLAGQPARIVKGGVTWDGRTPDQYGAQRDEAGHA